MEGGEFNFCTFADMKTQRMKKTLTLSIAGWLALCLACSDPGVEHTREQLSLAGNWGLQLDTTRMETTTAQLSAVCTDSLHLPGTTDEGQKGSQNNNRTETTYLSRAYIFEGRALYSKQVTIPADWSGRSIHLVMERTKPTTVWVDGQQVGSSDDITTAQRYELTRWLTPGAHKLTICVDNDPKSVPEKIYTSSHAYSPSTQTNWNGIIGDFYLEAAPLTHIISIRLYPDVERQSVRAKVLLHRGEEQFGEGRLSFFAETWNSDRKQKTEVASIPVDWQKEEQEFELPLGDEAQLWSEFHPALYRLTLSLETAQGKDVQQADFGLRDFRAEGKHFTINGNTTFLRGKHDACVFPLTGYTAMDVESWRHYFQVAKQYGINLYRFHSWCPPEACFEAADLEGIYLQPELPIWGSVEPNETELIDYLLKEGRNLHRAYGNHASFVMFALGNEMWGREVLGELVRTFRKEDNRHLYATGSNNELGFGGKHPDDDYFTTCRVGREEPQQFNTHTRTSFSFADAYDGGYLNHTYPNSTMDFSGANVLCDAPIISHETGQFQVYPNYKEMAKYRGVLKPYNMEVFKQRLEEAGLGEQAEEFFQASGKWSALLYRADIEMNLRTPDWGGFQLLDLQDYPGQGSAYVGMLDAFMESKGLITPEEWRQFCSEVVPLFRTDRFCWTNDETLTGTVELANYTEQALSGKQMDWILTDCEGETLAQGEWLLEAKAGALSPVGQIAVPLQTVQQAEKVNLSLRIEGTDYRNDYPLWIYPAKVTTTPAEGVTVATDWASCQATLSKGGKVIWFPDKAQLKEQTVGALFQTDYWNYRMFKSICEGLGRPVSPGTMGLLIDDKHPALANFPTEFHTNWQWFPIVKQSYPLIMDGTPKSLKPIVQVIDNVERNHKLGLLFECKVDEGSLLVCMVDLAAVQDKPEARQFYKSLLDYVASDSFAPTHKLTMAELRTLFTRKTEQIQMRQLLNISSYE